MHNKFDYNCLHCSNLSDQNSCLLQIHLNPINFHQETAVGHCIQKADTEESESCLGAMSKWKIWEESEGADAKSDQLKDTMGATSYPESQNDLRTEDRGDFNIHGTEYF